MDRVLTQELLDMTDLKHEKVSYLHLYIRPLEGEIMEVLEQDLQIFAGPKLDGFAVPAFEHLILFDEENLSLGLKKGVFSPQNDLDIAWVIKYARGGEKADLQGIDVFEFLVELALDKAQSQGGRNRGTNDKRLMTSKAETQ